MRESGLGCWLGAEGEEVGVGVGEGTLESLMVGVEVVVVGVGVVAGVGVVQVGEYHSGSEIALMVAVLKALVRLCPEAPQQQQP